MKTVFHINFKNPGERVTEYLRVLKLANYNKINPSEINIPRTETVRKTNSLVGKISQAEVSQNYNRRAALYCAFVHPVWYHLHGKVSSWYDTAAIAELLNQGKPLYEPARVNKLATVYVPNQEAFIKGIQISSIDFSKPFPEISIERYEMFMTLVKKASASSNNILCPPLDVDIVWHAHMLDHDAYAQATRGFFGSILDHDDNPGVACAKKEQYLYTAKLWRDHFGVNVPFESDASFKNWVRGHSGRSTTTTREDNKVYSNSRDHESYKKESDKLNAETDEFWDRINILALVHFYNTGRLEVPHEYKGSVWHNFKTPNENSNRESGSSKTSDKSSDSDDRDSSSSSSSSSSSCSTSSCSSSSCSSSSGDSDD